MKNGWTKALAQKDEKIAELKAFKQAVENGRCSECPFLGEAQNQYEQIATLKAEVERLRDQTISDGFGSTWSKKCPMCGKDTMEVVRPGKVQCANCG